MTTWIESTYGFERSGRSLADNGGIFLVIEASEGQSNGVSRAHSKAAAVKIIPSPKVEPIKVWIARVASERIDEMIDPEISIDRAIDMYRRKGYSEE